MTSHLRKITDKHPVTVVLLAALIVRVAAAIFSKGFGFDIEHFTYVEMTNAWLDNIQYPYYDSPSGISLFYISIHYLIFGFFKLLGVHDPQWLMFFSRLIHGVFSLLVISLGYRISKILSDRDSAIKVAWTLALLWFMPYVSVHNTAQAVAMPFLMYGILVIVKQDKIYRSNMTEKIHRTSFFIAGFFLGLAFSIWYQCIIFYVGILIALAVMMRWKGILMSLAGFIVATGITQTIPDLLVWGRPFVELSEFFTNSRIYLFSGNAHASWIYYSFLTIIVGLIPPMSFLLMFGFFRTWRKHLLVFLPTLLFLLYYTIFPNNNEIYILPVVPMFLICGILGWCDFKKNYNLSKKSDTTIRYITAFSIIVNLALLLIFITIYPNKQEVKAMTYLSKDDKVNSFIINDISNNEMKRPPLFYERKWSEYRIIDEDNTDILIGVESPRYVIFRDTKDLELRVQEMRDYFPEMKYEVMFKPHFTQILLNALNNTSDDGIITIYKIDYDKGASKDSD
ncbi:MAG: ArnT family glycosyltransferase [Candidatus Limimorpha sp.]